MTTTTLIDAETERLAEAVAQAKGRPVADIVREAIEASAREAGIAKGAARRLSPAEKLQRLLAISERSARRPLLDARTAEQIIEYDEHGMPR